MQSESLKEMIKNDPPFNLEGGYEFLNHPIKYIEIEVKNKKHLVKYAMVYFNKNTYLAYQLIGINFSFKIKIQDVYKRWNANFEVAVKESFEQFCEDYDKWRDLGFPVDWMIVYKNLFEEALHGK